MEILLKQIDLPNELSTYFDKSELEKVVVFRKHKRWDFYIKTKDALPFNVFYSLTQHMERSFKNIAEVDVILSSAAEVNDKEELYLYWRYFIAKLEDLLPTHLARLETAEVTEE